MGAAQPITGTWIKKAAARDRNVAAPRAPVDQKAGSIGINLKERACFLVPPDIADRIVYDGGFGCAPQVGMRGYARETLLQVVWCHGCVDEAVFKLNGGTVLA